MSRNIGLMRGMAPERIGAVYRATWVQCSHDVEPGETLCFDGHTFLILDVVQLNDGAVYRCRREDMRIVYIENMLPPPKPKKRGRSQRR